MVSLPLDLVTMVLHATCRDARVSKAKCTEAKDPLSPIVNRIFIRMLERFACLPRQCETIVYGPTSKF